MSGKDMKWNSRRERKGARGVKTGSATAAEDETTRTTSGIDEGTRTGGVRGRTTGTEIATETGGDTTIARTRKSAGVARTRKGDDANETTKIMTVSAQGVMIEMGTGGGIGAVNTDGVEFCRSTTAGPSM